MITLHNADCLDILPVLEANSIDTVITDPPYGLSASPDIKKVMEAWLAEEQYTHSKGGFMGKEWDSFVPGPRYWREIYRVMKPGGTLLCFASTRTFDLMGISLRFAGFEMHPFIAWINAQGFPKATSVSKMLDRAAGAEREVVGQTRAGIKRNGRTDIEGGIFVGGLLEEEKHIPVTAPATDEAQLWDGWYYGKQSLKPAIEPILMAQKPMDGTGFHNALVWGVAGLWIDGARIPVEGGSLTYKSTSCVGAGRERACNLVDRGDGKTPDGRNLEMALERQKRYRENAYETTVTGRWPANLLLSHVPGCECVGVRRVKGDKRGSNGGKVQHQPPGKNGIYGTFEGSDNTPAYGDSDGYETVEDWHCVEGCPVAMLDEQSGESGASRFFYAAKASRAERTCGGTVANGHPTVKNLSLMRYLVRLTKTPTGGVVLDPFMGSGTTGVACVMEGRDFIGIDNNLEYVEIARQRVAYAENELIQSAFTATQNE